MIALASITSLGADFAGIDADAVVEDFKIGMQHLTRWEKAAVVTDVPVDRSCDVAFQLPDARCGEGLFNERCRSSARVDRLALFIEASTEIMRPVLISGAGELTLTALLDDRFDLRCGGSAW